MCYNNCVGSRDGLKKEEMNMELVDERRFTIVDSAEMSTLAFLINEPEAGAESATIQKLRDGM